VAQAQISLCAYLDGYWSSWTTGYGLKIQGNYNGFIIYDENDGPWDPMFKFTINNFYMDTDSRSRKLQGDRWYEFSGTVEYKICDQYLTAYSLFKDQKGPSFITDRALKEAGRPGKKVTSRATIKIAPYKDHPKVYNIFYDNVGLGIDLNNIYFK